MLCGYGGGSGVSDDTNGVEDNDDNVESSEKSEVQLGLCKREVYSEPWENNI